MKVNIISLLLFCALARPVEAQRTLPPMRALFLETGGLSTPYSVNYAGLVFGSESWQTYFNAGLGIWDGSLSLPLGINLLIGRADHLMELRFGFGLYSEGLRFWNRDQSDIFLDLVAGVAYRYQPRGRSFFLSAGCYPYFRLDPTPDRLAGKDVTLKWRPGLCIGRTL